MQKECDVITELIQIGAISCFPKALFNAWISQHHISKVGIKSMLMVETFA